ncbi:tetratricopeptide repeat protein [Shewanella sedimentimangrovi]|uniref:Tetratricopeptide repeat protein n=1 Tax=Shewanella sedimentimangrovi TaxID=2814293 RepID=A0ABX7R049_9GAMM|nr:hypothetical protein [Shewanella sedimentimangrovi]QSX36595.1 hypothetical protein JYB85_15090 [Shewanella sedimentimangrovi]
MRLLVFSGLILGIVALSGCSHTTSIQSVDLNGYWHDELFNPVSDVPSPEQVFALPQKAKSELLQSYNRANMGSGNSISAHDWLSQQLRADKGGFQYYDNYTRIAEVTYQERQGNCMSLVVLSAALADVLNVPVEIYEVQVEPVWDKQGEFYLLNGHVNIRLMPPELMHTAYVRPEAIQIDFLPERAMRGYAKKKISRQAFLAMFYNNLAAESLIQGHQDRAYALIKQSLLQKPNFTPALNTLAILYRYRGHEDWAEDAYRLALRYTPEDLTTLYNLALLLGEQERLEEWAEIHKVLELARIRNPYYYYDMAQQAFSDHEYQQALTWYLRAVEKADYRHEFYFGLSKAYWATGNERKAKQSLEKALALSRDGDRKRYQSKLNAMEHH